MPGSVTSYMTVLDKCQASQMELDFVQLDVSTIYDSYSFQSIGRLVDKIVLSEIPTYNPSIMPSFKQCLKIWCTGNKLDGKVLLTANPATAN
jgi:hypothetical protein